MSLSSYPTLDRRHLLKLFGGGAAALAGFAGTGHALAAPAPMSGMASDAALLREVYMTLHPGLYRYNSPRAVAGLFDRLEQDWQRRNDLRSAFLSLSRTLAAIKCGHSYANFFNQKPSTHQALFTDIPRLPFLFRWIGGEMVVLASQGQEPALPAGTIVKRINGTPTRNILKQLMPYVRADGNNDAKRISLLSCDGTERWESFDIFYGNLFPDFARYRLDVILPDGRRSTMTRLPVTLDERRSAQPARPADKDAPAWTFGYDADGHAVLTMPGWALYNSKWDWQAFLDQIFADMASRGTKGLIVDIRNNEGGLDCGDAVLARLIDAPLQPLRYERRVRFRSVPAHLLQYMDTWDRSFATLGEGASERPGGFFALPAGAVERIDPKGPRFRGKVAVIIEPGNSSATWRFASIIKASGLATLVGDSTGGNQRGINGGGFYFLRLPNSGLEVDVPLIGAFPVTPQPDAGVDPDIRVIASARDIAEGRDPVMEAARRAVV